MARERRRDEPGPRKRRAAPPPRRGRARQTQGPSRPPRPPRPPQVRNRTVSAPRPEQRTRFRSGSPRTRLVVALIIIALVMGVIVVRVGMLQTASAESFRSAGEQQWTRHTDVAARRGTLFDRNGNELAMSVPAATISINPQLIEDGPATVRLLDDLLDLPRKQVDDLLDEIERKDRGFVYVARQVDREIGDQLESLDLPGVDVEEVDRRELTTGETAKNVLGETNIDGVGISGLELRYDELLAGSGGQMTREIAPGGRTIPGSETVTEEPVPGADLVLSIDTSIQYIVEQMLLQRVAEIPARGAQAIVMDVDSGELYAMASVRANAAGIPEITSGNFAAVEAYEPGSVAKAITIAGAIDAGAVTRDSYFEVPWRREYYDVMLSDSHQHATEAMNVWKILVTSSNIGTIEVQQAMGADVHHEYMRKFGWGRKTALDFPNESPGRLKPYEDMWGSEKLTPAYGQGVATTPVQLAAAINTIANDGQYVAPKLVLSTVTPDGEIEEAEPSPTRRVVSKAAADETAMIMRDVVCRGTAKAGQVEGLTIAGKTGTAFKIADNGTYWTDEGTRKYYASFVGFFPAEDPQVTVLVSVDEPAATNDRFGGTASAPVFAELAPLLLHELGIQPPAGGGCPDE